MRSARRGWPASEGESVYVGVNGRTGVVIVAADDGPFSGDYIKTVLVKPARGEPFFAAFDDVTVLEPGDSEPDNRQNRCDS